MPSLRALVVALCFTALALASAPSSRGQTLFDGNQNLPPYGGFSGGQFDTVSLQNGNLHLHIPVGSWTQRGGKTIWVAFEWDSPVAVRQTTRTTQNGEDYYFTRFNETRGIFQLASNGFSWSASSPAQTLNCPPRVGGTYNIFPSWVVTDPEGVQHPADVLSGQPGSCTNTAQVLSGPTEDGSGLMLNIGASPMLTLKDGTQIPLTCAGYGTGGAECIDSTGVIEDTNGNLTTQSGQIETDTLERTLWTITPGPITTLTTPDGVQMPNQQAYTLFTVTDSSGQPRTYRVDWNAFDVITNFCGSLNNPPYHSCGEPDAPLVLPSKLTLPNGSTYQFSWNENTFGQLGSIILPTGATISYTYNQSCLAGPLLGYYTIENVAYSCLAMVTSRTVALNGTNSTWTYTAPSHQVTVTDPLGNQQVHTFTNLEINSVYAPGSVETEVDYYQGSSNLLRRVVSAYTGEPFLQFGPGPEYLLGNVRPISVTTTLDNGYASQKQTDYETFSYNNGFATETATRTNPQEIREYDFGSGSPGPLMRRTDYSYLHNQNQMYANLNIVDRPSSVIVYNGSGTVVSQTQYEYDVYTAGIQPSSAVEHDSNRGTGYTTRGNVTATEHWRNTDGAWLTTRNQYDDAGNVLGQTDPLGNTTHYSYADSWATGGSSCAPTGGQAAAFLTLVTNALNQKTSYTYFSCTGLQGAVTDPNGHATTYSYDMFGRQAQVNYPDTGQTTYCYTDVGGSACNESGPPFSVVTTKEMSSSQNLVTTDLYDGLGRISEHQLNSDPDCSGGDKTDTTYDLLGRVYSVSNAYCTPGDSTYGVTTHTYDALGRTTQVANPDSSSVTTSYAGRGTEVTDESGKQRISQTDGLGRITSVCEVTSTTLSVGISGSTSPASCGLDISPDNGFLTTYGYDGLDDLTSVTQGPLNPRSFVYNSLGELVNSVNPEANTTTSGTVVPTVYTYDANGNLATKTDARGIMTTYSYDALNRLTGKTYSDGTSPAAYHYDETSSHGNTLYNTIGRLSSETTTGGTFSTLDMYSYDRMGRVITNWQYGYDGTTLETGGSPGYSYDLLGDVLGGLASGTGTVTNTYNSAGRLSGSTISYDNDYFGAPTTLISSPHYNALGERTSDILGDGETETWNFDNRGRQTSYSDVEGSNTLYSYSLSYFPNGNVMSSDDSVNGDWVYGYDDLNRLTSASFGGASYTYAYDRFGNRWEQNVTSGSGDMSDFAFDANNRVVGYTYDDAGDVTYDNVESYTVDAEGRIATVPSLGTTFVYDADGRREAIYQPSYGSTAYRGRVFYLDGSDMVETAGNQGRTRGEIFINGRHLLTIADLYSVFDHDDWLGSEHFRSYASNGTFYESCASNPFGDNLTCSDGTGFDMSPVHFAGKDRDTFFGYDSPSPDNLDNFGARYYRSGAARFLSPDPGNAGAEPVDAQSWNGYAYSGGNPVTRTDPNGLDYHICVTLDNGDGPQSCFNVKTKYDLQQQLKGTGATLSGTDQRGQILVNVNGKDVTAGTYQYFVGPGTEGEHGVPDISTDFLNLAGIADLGLDVGRLAVTGVSNLFRDAADEAIANTAEAVVAPTPANPIEGLPRVGHALKKDWFHSFPNIIDNYASGATRFTLSDGGELYQIEGSLGGKPGRFEWIVRSGEVVHRFFVENGTINGIPSTP